MKVIQLVWIILVLSLSPDEQAIILALASEFLS